MSRATASRRRRTVKNAIANERLEGLKVNKKSKEIAKNYVVGKASARDAAKKIRARYGVL